MDTAGISQRTWLITGASSGLGLELALAVLRGGDRVIGTGRNTRKAASETPEFARLGGQWLQLDVSEPHAVRTLQLAVEKEEQAQQGKINWVVANNAGSTILGAVEDMSDEQMLQYMQANVFGFIRIWKAMLPTLRRNRQGTVLTTSSIFGFVSKPEHMMYSAVKATVESLTESYAELLAPFGIRTLIIEPGGFRTPFAGNNAKADGGISVDYKERIGAWMDFVDAAGKDASAIVGDPRRFGERVLEAVRGTGAFEGLWREQPRDKVLRVQLGSDCYALFGDRLKGLSETYAKMADIAKSTDFQQ